MPTPSITASSGATGVLKQWTIRAPPYTFLDGINNSGVIQGQIYDAGFVAEGFTATSGGLFNIVNYPGPLMTAIVGINDRGDLCGSYWQTFGINTAFVASDAKEGEETQCLRRPQLPNFDDREQVRDTAPKVSTNFPKTV